MESTTSHADHPIVLHDVFSRVGGAAAGKAAVGLQINTSDTIVDHTWDWRAGVGWTENTDANGLVVNEKKFTIYGLFVEHYQQCYQSNRWFGSTQSRAYTEGDRIPLEPTLDGIKCQPPFS